MISQDTGRKTLAQFENMSLLQRGEEVYSTTSLLIPVKIKKEAQELGINMTQVLVKALETEVERRKNEVKA